MVLLDELKLETLDGSTTHIQISTGNAIFISNVTLLPEKDSLFLCS